MQISDGRQTDFGQVAVHWDIARMALDAVKPAGGAGPAPGRDEMVRQWYRATAAWMQQAEDHDTAHLDHAREIFSTDPDILFLSGAQHETYSTARIQSAVRPPCCRSVSFAVGRNGELRRGGRVFAARSRSRTTPGRLRLGRVLGLLGRHADAARGSVGAASPTKVLLRRAVSSAEEEALAVRRRLRRLPAGGGLARPRSRRGSR
jgi:hypothetical protein